MSVKDFFSSLFAKKIADKVGKAAETFGEKAGSKFAEKIAPVVEKISEARLIKEFQDKFKQSTKLFDDRINEKNQALETLKLQLSDYQEQVRRSNEKGSNVSIEAREALQNKISTIRSGMGSARKEKLFIQAQQKGQGKTIMQQLVSARLGGKAESNSILS